MKGVAVQWVDNVYDAVRGVHIDRGAVDRVWHCSVEGPVPIRDPEGGCRGLVLASQVYWVCYGYFLCVVP